MDSLLAENEKAIKQRIVDLKLKDQEIVQFEKLQRMKKVDQEIRREAIWFKASFIFIGIVIGLPAGGVFTQWQSEQGAVVTQPIEQVSGR